MRSEDTDQNNSYVISNCTTCQILNHHCTKRILNGNFQASFTCKIGERESSIIRCFAVILKINSYKNELEKNYLIHIIFVGNFTI